MNCGILSYKLKLSEKNYTIYEEEMHAIYKSFENFEKIISSSKKIVFSDCCNVIENFELSRRSNRYKLFIEQYNYLIVHIQERMS